MRFRTPQEKKRLSDLKDRRNAYGQHDKGSRRDIRQPKALPQRAYRRHVHQCVTVLTPDAGLAEAAHTPGTLGDAYGAGWPR